MIKYKLLWVLITILLSACTSKTRFTSITSSHTGIKFENKLVEDTSFNFLNYLYYYNGGGVAAGDINNDGLDDLFFTSNQEENKLYLNRGDFQFEDITISAGITHQVGSWSTGVSMVDINGDGWLDIYVCNVNYLSRVGHNQLFLNNQDGTFTEQAKKYGIDFEGYSVQTAYLDYDKDGDLDLFLLNHSIHSIYSYAPIETRSRIDPKSGDRLFRNEGETFVDVSSEAGIFSSALGFGLGVTINDINQDGWMDIYVANDFHEDDYLYINQKDGTFKESIRESVQHTGQFTMSVDIADINNDGLNEIVTTDMLPFDEHILKKSGGGDTYQVARIKESYGYYPQYARNMLQLNVGYSETENPIFSEIGYLAGIEATDWSWSGLLADLDNDGFRDFYIANGIFRRPNDLDYIKYISSSDIQNSLEQGINPENLKLIQRMPKLKIPNAVFKNEGNLRFSDNSKAWGLGDDSYSNGATYSDLDNDGDLDLIVNNVNQPAYVYKNNSSSYGTQKHNYLKFKLKGLDGNTSGIGTKIKVYAKKKVILAEQSPVRGFQSSVSHIIHLGLGDIQHVDSIHVIWPDDRFELLLNIELNELIELNQYNAKEHFKYNHYTASEPFFTDITAFTNVNFNHTEDDFSDFDNERLIPHYKSTLGPPIDVADVNGDGLDDFFIGNAASEAGQLWIQDKRGRFNKVEQEALYIDRFNEDTDAIFFDANGDGYPDLLVTSGDGKNSGKHNTLIDRLYINNGNGNFKRSKGLPATFSNSATVSHADFDNDGDQDLFIGGASVPGIYGYDPISFLLQNDGNGQFKDVTDKVAPELRYVGMVTDSEWYDFDLDGDMDLALVGEWMPITIFSNVLDEVEKLPEHSSAFQDMTSHLGLDHTYGWWNTIEIDDIDEDGYFDILAGNLGLNSYLNASETNPLYLYLNDFDMDRRADPILVHSVEGVEYTVALIDDLFSQMNVLKRGFTTYDEFSKKGVSNIFNPAVLDSSIIKKATMFESVLIKNNNAMNFEVSALPIETQFSPVYNFYVSDVDGNGKKDIFVNGNFYGVRPFFGRYDANYGTILLQQEELNFKTSSINQNGIQFYGEIRDIEKIELSNGDVAIIVSKNNEDLHILRQNYSHE